MSQENENNLKNEEENKKDKAAKNDELNVEELKKTAGGITDPRSWMNPDFQ